MLLEIKLKKNYAYSYNSVLDVSLQTATPGSDIREQKLAVPTMS